jgi:Fungal N-terminal domain of STAND proteins
MISNLVHGLSLSHLYKILQIHDTTYSRHQTAMDGLSVASSIIAVIEVSAKVASLCAQYCNAVKKAKQDITRLQGVVGNINSIVKDCHDLLEGQHASKLESSQKLKQALNECSSDLKRLEDKLKLGRGQKAISHLGIRALQWPFTSKEVDKIIQDLKRSKEDITLAMQIDQTYVKEK